MSVNRLEKILKLAQSSSFEGERHNAIAAAKKYIKNGAPARESDFGSGDCEKNQFEPFNCFALYDYYIKMDKERIRASLERARAIGLNAEAAVPRKVVCKKTMAQFARELKLRNKRRDPLDHAAVLMRETLMDLAEISSITGVDLHALEEMRG